MGYLNSVLPHGEDAPVSGGGLRLIPYLMFINSLDRSRNALFLAFFFFYLFLWLPAILFFYFSLSLHHLFGKYVIIFCVLHGLSFDYMFTIVDAR